MMAHPRRLMGDCSLHRKRAVAERLVGLTCGRAALSGPHGGRESNPRPLYHFNNKIQSEPVHTELCCLFVSSTSNTVRRASPWNVIRWDFVVECTARRCQQSVKASPSLGGYGRGQSGLSVNRIRSPASKPNFVRSHSNLQCVRCTMFSSSFVVI